MTFKIPIPFFCFHKPQQSPEALALSAPKPWHAKVTGDGSVFWGVSWVSYMDFGELLWDYFILDFWFVFFSILNISLISLTHILPKDVKVVFLSEFQVVIMKNQILNSHKFTEWSSSVSSSHLEGLGEICCLWLWMDVFFWGGRSYTMLHVRQVW